MLEDRSQVGVYILAPVVVQQLGNLEIVGLAVALNLVPQFRAGDLNPRLQNAQGDQGQSQRDHPRGDSTEYAEAVRDGERQDDRGEHAGSTVAVDLRKLLIDLSSKGSMRLQALDRFVAIGTVGC